MPLVRAFPSLTRDGKLLFSTRITRLFAYGLLAVVLALYLAERGLSETRIGLVLTLTLVGDVCVSLLITTNADRVGRRRMLLLGAGVMAATGIVFALSDHWLALAIAATLGVISPSGYEVGPFLSLEQAALAQTVGDEKRTHVFAWYNLVGSFATAAGSLAGGAVSQALQSVGMSPLASYRAILLVYAAMGLVLWVAFWCLSQAIEARGTAREEPSSSPSATRLGLGRSSKVVLRLAALFSLDAFGGGFVVQAMVAYWFQLRFDASPALLGGIFFGANVLAGVSALSAAWVARKIGLLNTMVFTHLPSNALLMLVPVMPTLPAAIVVLLLRFSISQMDVPTRQSYTMAVVRPEERSAAAGITGVARSVGAALAPLLTGPLLASPALMGAPFVLAGGVKIVYDFLIWRSFRALRPPEEQTA